MPADTSEWQYTVRIGYSDEQGKWVAQIVDDRGEELLVVTGATVGETVGRAAVAIMDVHDDESGAG